MKSFSSVWIAPPKIVSNLERVTEQAKVAKKVGFALREPIYALGTPVIQVGVENAYLARKEFDSMPLAQEALEQLRDHVKAEKRRDLAVKVGNLSIDSKTGQLHRHGCRNNAMFTDLGFRQMFNLLPKSPEVAGRYLASIPPDRRARETREILKENSDYDLVLRLRTPVETGEPQIYSVVTEKYADYGPISLTEDLLKLIKREPQLTEMRAEVAYHGNWTTVRLLSHSTVKPENFVAGELFRVALAFKLSDDKSSSVRVWAETFRNLCLNLIVIDTARQGLMRRRHIGDSLDIGKELQLAAKNGIAKIGPFLAMWSKGRGIEIQDMTSVVNTLAHVECESKVGAMISVPNVEPADLASKIITVHKAEPEQNLIGLVNAMTRAAHESIWADPLVVAENLQFQAGQLLRLNDKSFRRLLDI